MDVHVAVFVSYHDILRAKLSFPKQKSYKGQNISQYINILRARETLSFIINTDFAAFYLSCEYKCF